MLRLVCRWHPLHEPSSSVANDLRVLSRLPALADVTIVSNARTYSVGMQQVGLKTCCAVVHPVLSARCAPCCVGMQQVGARARFAALQTVYFTLCYLLV